MRRPATAVLRIVLPLIVLLGALPLRAGTDCWSAIGPYGGDVNAMAADPANPSVVYAATMANGVFKSTDAGLHWTKTGSGIPAGTVWTLAVDPSQPLNLYVGMFNKDCYESNDGGASWHVTGWPLGSVYNFAFCTAAPSTIYAVGNGVSKSIDGGATWIPVFTGDEALGVNKIVVDPSHPDTVYAATSELGVVKSQDGGQTYHAANAGIRAPFVYDLVVDPSNPLVLYATAMAYLDVYVGGVYKSLDGGTSWQLASQGLPDRVLMSLAMDPASASTLYAVTNHGQVYATRDGAASWTATAAEFSNAPIQTILAFDTRPTTVAVAPLGLGIYRSQDDGRTWAASNDGLAGLLTTCLAMEPTTPPTLLVGAEPGLLSTTDGGATWQALPMPPTLLSPARILPAAEGATFYLSASNAGLWKTSDGGMTYSDVGHGLFAQTATLLAMDPSHADTVYALGDQGLYVTKDGAATWSPLGALPGSNAPNSLAVDPARSRTLYASSVDANVRSKDGGRTWRLMNRLASGVVNSFLVSRASSQTVYAGGAGIWQSKDAGAHWTRLLVGLPPDVYVRVLLQDPRSPSTLYAGTYAGVYKSFDGGLSWGPLPCGLTLAGVEDLALSTVDGTLFAATYGGGIYALAQVTTVTGMKASQGPFAITVTGTHLQEGIRVFINGVQWPQVTWRNEGSVVLGGSALPAAVPKRTPTDLLFLNPDGSSVSFTWQWR